MVCRAVEGMSRAVHPALSLRMEPHSYPLLTARRFPSFGTSSFSNAGETPHTRAPLSKFYIQTSSHVEQQNTIELRIDLIKRELGSVCI
jgi:hypothetical protein